MLHFIDNDDRDEEVYPETTTTTTTTTSQDQKFEKASRVLNKKLIIMKANQQNAALLPYNKRSACFWCTYPFEGEPTYIPKGTTNQGQGEGKGVVQVYGCFCSTECASAFLLEEVLDTSVKFERIQLLHQLYKVPIRPAPNPYYMLEKFYGQLTIDEYRSLPVFKKDKCFLSLDTPLMRVVPELYEENTNFMLHSQHSAFRKGTAPILHRGLLEHTHAYKGGGSGT